MSTLESLEWDLIGCGVPAPEATALADRYARALETGSHADWIELYVGIFATVRRSLDNGAPRSRPAFERVLLLLNDDLGSELFDKEARVELADASRTTRPAGRLA
jgi:hypothetical protein